MELQPTQARSFKAMSTPKKAATVAGALAATAAIASVPVAYAKGKKGGEEKLIGAIKEGYKAIGSTIAKKAKSVYEVVSEKVKDIKGKILKPKAPKAEPAAK